MNHLMPTPMTLAFFQNIGWMEMIIIGAILLILFGRRLPEVGKSLGQGIVEFKKGLKGVQDDVSQSTQTSPPSNTQAQLPNQQKYDPRPQQGQPNTISRSTEA